MSATLQEEYRLTKVLELRSLFARLCSDINLAVPRVGFNRWLLENSDKCTVDPIIPSAPSTYSLKYELLEHVPLSGNLEVDNALLDIVTKDIDWLCINMAKASTEMATEVAAYSVNGIAIVDAFQKGPRMELSCNRTVLLHMVEYKALLSKHRNKKGETVLDDVYRLCLRYEALSGPETGLQVAVAPRVFKYLRTLGVSCECFASPFNATLNNYYSAFADTDKVFGSKGSFFDANLPSGFYEVNPPFAEAFMTRVVERLHHHLRMDIPMSYICFVPGWDDSNSIRSLLDSKYAVRVMKFSSKQALFTRNGKPFAIPSGTYVCVLQNKSGSIKWPLLEKSLLEKAILSN